MCTCPEGNKTCYVLGDTNLFCDEGENATELWQKMVPEAAGTHRMKAPEVHSIQCMHYYVCNSVDTSM